jgi:hypothetical protein
MSLKNQMIVILLCFLLAFFYIRGFLYGLKRYQLSNGALKRRKNRETFKEWFFYSLYKDEIPRILRVLYYSILIVHLVGLIACLLIHFIEIPFIESPSMIGGIIAVKIVGGFNAIWMLVISLAFGGPKRSFAYERWITRKSKPKKGKK